MIGAMSSDKPAPVEFPERPEGFNLASFDCPRCGETISAEHYGLCQRCVVQLQASQRGEGSDGEAAAYEPKMNVTPNAVALKE